jgi:hypothetical protein
MQAIVVDRNGFLRAINHTATGADQIRGLVYLDAFVPEDGECVLDLRSHEQVLEMRQQIQTTGDGWKVAPIPAEVFNVNSHDCAWVNTQCTPQSLACFEEPIRLRGGLARITTTSDVDELPHYVGIPDRV